MVTTTQLLTILANVADDIELIKITTTAFCTKWLLESDLKAELET